MVTTEGKFREIMMMEMIMAKSENTKNMKTTKRVVSERPNYYHRNIEVI